MTTPLFFELKRYGDFDIPYTDSIWYKVDAPDMELTYHKHGTLLNEMLIEFRKLSGERFSTAKGFDSRSIYIAVRMN